MLLIGGILSAVCDPTFTSQLPVNQYGLSASHQATIDMWGEIKMQEAREYMRWQREEEAEMRKSEELQRQIDQLKCDHQNQIKSIVADANRRINASFKKGREGGYQDGWDEAAEQANKIIDGADKRFNDYAERTKSFINAKTKSLLSTYLRFSKSELDHAIKAGNVEAIEYAQMIYDTCLKAYLDKFEIDDDTIGLESNPVFPVSAHKILEERTS